jgi:hypothetical protein
MSMREEARGCCVPHNSCYAIDSKSEYKTVLNDYVSIIFIGLNSDIPSPTHDSGYFLPV